jgi:hypothetical protein
MPAHGPDFKGEKMKKKDPSPKTAQGRKAPKKERVSIYTGKAPTKAQRISAPIETVGELREALKAYPGELPLAESEGYVLVWFNLGQREGTGECLGLELNDGTWTTGDF